MSLVLNRVIRLDSLPLGQTIFTQEGYLMDRPILTSTGIFEYTNPDGSIRRELRLPEEVFDPESLKSYKGKPIIITHDAGLIDKNNVDEEQIGTILSEGYRSDDDVRAEIVIHNTDEMRECGLKELSLGYSLDLDETPGEWNGEHYDAIQRNIRINHLALVREARAGEQARLNIDSRDKNTLIGGKAMKNKKKSNRADCALSEEELMKAIEMYKAQKQAKEDGDDEAATEENPVSPEALAEDDDTVITTSGEDPDDVEKKVQMVKDRRDRRDADGDPGDVETAQGIIAHQDEDIEALLGVIDTLLAQKEFGEKKEDADETAEVPVAAVPEKTEEDAEDDDFAAVAEEGDKDEVGTDEDDADPVLEEDGDDCEDCGNADEDGDEDPAEPAKKEVMMNADSVDAIVKTRIQLGMIGRELNLDGLENLSIIKAKKAIIKKIFFI